VQRIEVGVAVRISKAPFLLSPKLLLPFHPLGVRGVYYLKHRAFRLCITQFGQALFSDHLSIRFILNLVDDSLNVKKLDSKIFSSLNYIWLDLLHFFDVERVTFSQNWYDISELLELFYRHEILVLGVMAVKEEEDQMDPFVWYFIKLILKLLSVILELKLNFFSLLSKFLQSVLQI